MNAHYSKLRDALTALLAAALLAPASAVAGNACAVTVTPSGGSPGAPTAAVCMQFVPRVSGAPDFTQGAEVSFRAPSFREPDRFTYPAFPTFADDAGLSFSVQDDDDALWRGGATFVRGAGAGDLEVSADEGVSIRNGALTEDGYFDVGNLVALVGEHRGTGSVLISSAADIVNANGGHRARGIMGWVSNRNSAAAVTVRATGGAISTAGVIAGGIHAQNDGLGEVTIFSAADITTAGLGAPGIIAWAGNGTSTGNEDSTGAMTVHAAGGTIVTAGNFAPGVAAIHHGLAAVSIRSNADITTRGQVANGVLGAITNVPSNGAKDSTAGLSIAAGGTIRTMSAAVADLYGAAPGATLADLARPAANRARAVGGADLQDGVADPTESNGVFGLQSGRGPLTIESSADIATAGTAADGIEAWISNAGSEAALAVRMTGGAIATAGAGSHGIHAHHAGSGSIEVQMTGGSIRAAGAGSHGVHARYDSSGTAAVVIHRGASIEARGAGAAGVSVAGARDDPGTGRPEQTVTVNGRVTASGGAAGVRTDGGTVVIGPTGAVTAADAASRAIVSTAPAAGDTVVRIQGGASRVDGRIVNVAPANIIIETAGGDRSGVRDGDEIYEAARRTSVRVDGAGISFASGGFSGAGAVYEALPQALLDQAAFLPDSSAAAAARNGLWARAAYADGDRDADRSTTGAEFDHERWFIEAGADLFERRTEGGVLRGGLSLHALDGDVDASLPGGSGGIDIEGQGVGAHVSWRRESGAYANASVRFTRFENDLRAAGAGRLAENVDADALSFAAETGRIVREQDDWALTARARVSYASVDIDAFTEQASMARVAAEDIDSFRLGAGLALRHGNGLRASLDVEHEFDGEAAVRAGSDVLEREPQDTWARASVGANCEWGDGKYVLYGALDYAASFSGSSDDFGGNVGWRVNF